jgi:hypothetical protein
MIETLTIMPQPLIEYTYITVVKIGNYWEQP